ncbi:hypothetical protein GCM10010094_18810 [Streptomyces flaveus]|uniref:Uncharacterized protein n=1 Tax=Streptomyces flaveus TaxID=66370 RepID=A0A917QMM3_9ACTN|nr:hypothetical protein GCM10010094_18810 [Streptomyces flaveus]
MDTPAVRPLRGKAVRANQLVTSPDTASPSVAATPDDTTHAVMHSASKAVSGPPLTPAAKFIRKSPHGSATHNATD